MATSVSGRPAVLLTVMTYGTSWPRVTFRSGVVFVIASAPLTSGSSGMWLLKICADPGTWLSSSIRCTWYTVPDVRAGTEAAGANSEACTSQNCAVPGITSAALPGQAGTEKAAVVGSDAGGMTCEYPAT